MLVIKVKDNESIDKALKRFKKKFEQTKVLRQLRGRTHYVKPSVANRKRRIKESYKQGLYAKEHY
ncbi:MAG: small subunit ribosomal protein S21 [Flammeovirgaceae bacterium]|jgi:small subunit ribosomal protein S21